MRKILFVCNDGYNTTNTRVRCYRFSNELNKMGISSEVFSFKDSLNASYEGFESYKTAFIERLSLLSRAIRRLLQEDRSTIFYIQKSGYFALAPLVVSLIKGNRLILDYDDYEYEQSIISRCMLRLLCKRAVFSVAASTYLEHLLKKLGSKAYYIPTGVDTKIFKPIRPKKAARSVKQVVFAWVGFVVDKDAANNLIFLLDSFNEAAKGTTGVASQKRKAGTNLRKEPIRTKARLEIVGGGRHLNEILGHIESLHNKNIVYKGMLSPDLVPGYLDSVDVGLFILSKDTKYNRSKSPTKLFEYMAKGLAVISTGIGESGSIISDGHDGLLIHSQQELIAKLALLANDRQLIRKLGKNAALLAAKNYSLAVLGKRLAEIINTEIQE
jgi:glycosyltransferase involved in cell wall biosynthesis